MDKIRILKYIFNVIISYKDKLQTNYTEAQKQNGGW